MFSFFKRYRDVLVVGALLLAPLVSFLKSGHKGREPNIVDRAVLAVSSPLQRGLTFAVDGVGGATQGYVALRGAHQEASQCRVALAEATAEANALKEEHAENARLKGLLGYAETSTMTEIPARIIGLNTSPRFQSVRIDRGQDDGVHVGMPVVTHRGVVGQVVRAVPRAADVMLITDPASSIGAVLQRTRTRALVVGTGDGRLLSLDFVRREEALEKDDVIVTSGTDGIFPRGLPLGTVQAFERPQVGLFLSGQVTPAVDLLRVEEVLIIPVASPLSLSSAQEGAP